VLGSLPVAAAQRPVTVAVERCPALPETALRALMRAELGGLLVDAGDGVERVLVSCDGELARVTVASAGGPPLARSLSLAGFPADARPRLLALVAVELLAAERPEIRRRPGDARDAGAGARGASARWRRGRCACSPAAAGGCSWRAQGLAAWTGGVRVETALGRRLELALDAELGGARRALGLGASTGGWGRARRRSGCGASGVRPGRWQAAWARASGRSAWRERPPDPTRPAADGPAPLGRPDRHGRAGAAARPPGRRPGAGGRVRRRQRPWFRRRRAGRGAVRSLVGVTLSGGWQR
jgi:hypothetical protein